MDISVLYGVKLHKLIFQTRNFVIILNYINNFVFQNVFVNNRVNLNTNSIVFSAKHNL